MKIKFWGTRGSLPKPSDNNQLLQLLEQEVQLAKSAGIKTLDEFLSNIKKDNKIRCYGGHTTCTELKFGPQNVIVDLGSGVTDYGYESLKSQVKEHNIFLTHMHWDHIMGLPFFVPLYTPRTKITIYHVHKNAPQHVQILFNGINFPVKWEDLAATIVFKHIKLYQKVDLGNGIQVSPFTLDHPGGSFGYRFDWKGKSVAIGVDGEYKRLSADELGKDLVYYQNLDALLFDAQYELDELASRYDWGHCSPPIGVDLALREGIKNLFLCHHDPRANTYRIDSMLQKGQEHLQSNLSQHKKLWEKLKQPNGPIIRSAYDGMEVEI